MTDLNDNYPDIPRFIQKRVEDELGRIISSINDPVYVGLYTDSRIKAAIQPHKSVQMRLGDYLLVYDYIRGETIAVKIIGHSTQTIDEDRTSDHLFNLDSETGYQKFINKRYDFLRTPHIFHLDPIKKVEISKSGIQTQGSVDFAPSESAAVFKPLDSELIKIIGLKEEGLNMGVLARESEIQTFKKISSSTEYLIPIKISLDSLNRHVSINGSTGSGKTVVIKYLIYELQKQGATVLITDTQGDFVSQLYRSELTEEQRRKLDNEKVTTDLISTALDIDYNDVGVPKEKIQVFFPPFLDDDVILTDLRRNGVVTLPLQLSSNLISSWGTLATVMPNLNDTQYQGLELLFRRYVDEFEINEKSQFFNLNEFYKWIENNRETLRSELFIHRGTIQVILRNLNLLIQKEILDRTKHYTKYEDLMKEGFITILYLPSDNPEVLSVRPLIQLLVYNLIQKYRAATPTQRVIIIDEAQEVIPHEKEARSKTVAYELAKQFRLLAQQGRKYRISLIVASQEPRRISRTVFSQCSTRIFLKLPSEDIESIKLEIPKECKRAIIRLKVGSGLIKSSQEIEEEHVWIRFPMPPIYHEPPAITKSKIKKEFPMNKMKEVPENAKAKSLKEEVNDW